MGKGEARHEVLDMPYLEPSRGEKKRLDKA
jgi:hypothetical protein